MGQITATRNLVATKVVRHAGQWHKFLCTHTSWWPSDGTDSINSLDHVNDVFMSKILFCLLMRNIHLTHCPHETLWFPVYNFQITLKVNDFFSISSYYIAISWMLRSLIYDKLTLIQAMAWCLNQWRPSSLTFYASVLCGMKLLLHCKTSRVAPWKFGNG